MIAFIIHDACCSGDKVMFAESLEIWLEAYRKKYGWTVFEKRGEIDSGKEYGRLHRLWAKDERPENYEALQKLCVKKGWEQIEPKYVEARTITPELELNFGG
jgi:hypothetical protein